jgi:hypothetical protein
MYVKLFLSSFWEKATTAKRNKPDVKIVFLIFLVLIPYSSGFSVSPPLKMPERGRPVFIMVAGLHSEHIAVSNRIPSSKGLFRT